MPGRWITVHKPFDYRWPSRAITSFSEADLGEHMVKGELADFAVENGFATEGKVDGSEAKSHKGKRTRAGKSAKVAPKEAAPAKTADHRPNNRVDLTDAADDDRADDGSAVDDAAG